MTVTRRFRVRGSSALAALALAACSSGQAVAPSSPETTVQRFLSAVKANSLDAMAQLWGTSRGPNAGRMDREELDQRLTVIKIYLEHDQFAIVPEGPVTSATRDPSNRTVFVRLSRRGCKPVVPFTLVPYRGGWLVLDVDLVSAGNPARPCAAARRIP